MTEVRPLRLQIGLLFAVVLVAFVGANLLAILAVWPQLQRLERIYGTVGESLHVISEMRGVAADMRATATIAILQEGGEREAAAAGAEVALELGQLARLGERYEPLVDDADEARAWQHLRDVALPDLAARAVAGVEAATRGGASAESVQAIIAQSRTVDGLFEELGRRNASVMQQSASTVRRSLTRLLALSAGLLVLGGAGATLLAVRALSLLREYGADTQRRLAELDAFAARVAHDLRSPLQTILLALSGISQAGEDERSRSAAARAERGVRRLNAMIVDLLEFARSGATPEPGARAEVAATFREVEAELGPLAEEAGVRLALRAEPDVWVAGAPAALRSVVANLVENGIKYARAEGERRVEATARAQGQWVRLEVRDDGLGIAAERLPTIFDPFAHPRVRPDSYGLGLATVRRLVDAHGGAVSVESAEGAGTTFTVDLPRVAVLPRE